MFKVKNNRIIYNIFSIIGLSVGVWIFLSTLIFINYQSSFDRKFTESDNIYRIQLITDKGKTNLLLPQSVTEIFKQNAPQISKMTRVLELPIVKPFIKVNDRSNLYVEHLYYVDKSFFSIFKFKHLYGKFDNVDLARGNIILSDKVSKNLFASNNPIGKTVSINDESNLLIQSVVKTDDGPSHFAFDALEITDFNPKSSDNLQNNTYTYIKIKNNISIKVLEQQLNRLYQANIAVGQHLDIAHVRSVNSKIYLMPLKDIHLKSKSDQEMSISGNPSTILFLSAIGLSMLIVTAINFINLNLAFSDKKIKGVAIRRILGASKFSIIVNQYGHIFMKCLIAFIFAFFILTISFSYFQQKFQLFIPLYGSNWINLSIQVVILFFLVVALTGLYPSLKISFFSPANVIKGNGNIMFKRSYFRTILLISQFIVTSMSIIGLVIISKQIDYMKKADLGFSPSQVLVISPSQIQTQFNFQTLKTRLKNISGVENVSWSSTIGNSNEQTTSTVVYNGVEYKTQYVCVDPDYINVIGGRFIKGENFKTIVSDSVKGDKILVNKEMADLINLKNLSDAKFLRLFDKPSEVIGIIENINLYGFENKLGPMVFTTKKYTLTPYLLVKIKRKDINETVAKIETLWKSIESSYPMRYQFFDHYFQKKYTQYDSISSLFRFFTACAISIVITGLFSIVAVITLQRKKEIAIRRIVGAETFDILYLIIKPFFTAIIIANFSALIVSHFFTTKWLENFSHHVNIPYFTIILSILLVSVFTISLVAINVLRVIRNWKIVNVIKE